MNPIQSKQQIFQSHSRPIKDLKFVENGELIYSASSDRSVVCWNVRTGEKIRSYEHSAAVNIIALTRNLQLMVTGDNTGGLYIWDTQGGVLLKRMEQDSSLCVRSISFSNDDEMMLVLLAGRSKGAASFIQVYKMSDIMSAGEQTTDPSQTQITSKINNSNTNINTENINNSIPQQEFSNLSGLIRIPENQNNSKSKGRKQSGTQSKTPPPQIINVAPFKIFECKTEGTKWVQAKFAFMEKSLIISREDGFLELINFSNGKQIIQNKFHNDIILDFDYNFGLILTASRDGTACIINFDSFLEIKKFHPQNPTRNLNACRLAQVDNPEYEIDVNCKEDGSTILKFDVDDFFNSTNEMSNPGKIIKKNLTLAILSGGQDSKLVTTTNQKEGGFEILIYDTDDGELLGNFLTHFGPVNTLAVSKDILASGAEDATVRIYKIQNYLFPIDKNK